MSGKEQDIEAALVALGVLDEEPGATVSRDGADPAFAAEIARWEMRLAGLARAVPQEAPSSEAFAAVLRTIRGPEPRQDQSGGTVTVRAEEGRWREMAPGVAVKLLWLDRSSRRRAVLMRVAPGAVYPSHAHDGDEECLVLEGEVSFGELTLRAGDFHLARKGHRHPPAASPQGCVLYISGPC